MTQSLHRPVLGAEELAAVAEVLASGHLVQGPQVAAFEERLKTTLDVRHVVAVSSGTAALHASIVALGATAHDTPLSRRRLARRRGPHPRPCVVVCALAGST